MKKRLLCLSLVAIVTQLFGTGCFFFHPVARWRANHPCGTYHHHPLLHPIQTRRAIFSEGYQGSHTIGVPACHGCATPGVPVSFSGASTVVPTGVPTIGYPTPITPGPTVVPSYELPSPMPVPDRKNGGN